MDAQIRKIERENKKEGKDLKKLEVMDKKRDKIVEVGKMAMKKKHEAPKDKEHKHKEHDKKHAEHAKTKEHKKK